MCNLMRFKSDFNRIKSDTLIRIKSDCERVLKTSQRNKNKVDKKLQIKVRSCQGKKIRMFLELKWILSALSKKKKCDEIKIGFC